MTSIADAPVPAGALTAWAEARLGERGVAVTGEITEPHVRQWSRVLRVTTTNGVVWAKSNCRGFAYEAGLADILARYAPDYVLHPLATDAAAGLMLLPDGGSILADQPPEHRTIERWSAVLREYADLQRLLEAHVPEMLAAGVPDLRPHRIPELYAGILYSPLRIGEPEGITADEHAELRRLTGTVARWSGVLADSGTPPTIQHDDLHRANVFVQNGAGYRIFDWGDAVVTHPFATLLTASGTARESFGL